MTTTRVEQMSGHTVTIEVSEDRIRASFEGHPGVDIVVNRGEDGRWHDPQNAEFEAGPAETPTTQQDALAYVRTRAADEAAIL